MKSIKAFGPAPNISFGHSTEVSAGIIQTESNINFVIYTIEFVNLFPIKMHRNYFRKKIDADQCSRQIMVNGKVNSVKKLNYKYG